MRFSRTIRALLVVFCAISFSQGAFAQKYEIYPYAGGFWPMKIDEFKMMDQFMWGVKGGYFLSDNVQLEGNFGYLNHFKFEDNNLGDFVNLNNITVITVTNTAATKNAKDGKIIPGTQSVVVKELDPNRVTIVAPDPKQRGYLWEANLSYNFFGNRGFVPYLTAGIGGTTVTRSSTDIDTSDVIIDGSTFSVLELEQIRDIVDDRIGDAREILPSPINAGSYFTFNYGGGFKGYRLWGPVGARMDFLGRNLPNFGRKALNAFQLTAGITVAWGER